MGKVTWGDVQRTSQANASNSECIIYLDKAALDLTIDEYENLRVTLEKWSEQINDNIVETSKSSGGCASNAFLITGQSFMFGDFGELHEKTKNALDVMETTSYCANQLLLRCENFRDILDGASEYNGDILPVAGAAAVLAGIPQKPMSTELYLELTYYGDGGGVLSTSTEAAVMSFKKISEKNDIAYKYLSSLEFEGIDISAEYMAIKEDCEKKDRLTTLYNSFVMYVNGVNNLITLTVEGFEPIIDKQYNNDYSRNYTYPGYKTPDQNIVLERALRAKLHELGITDEEIDKALSYGHATLEQLVITNVNSRGERIGIENNYFVRVILPSGEVAYGGAQDWYTNQAFNEIKISPNGCGVIAAVNQYLYLTGQTEITQEKYIGLINAFIIGSDDVDFSNANDPNQLAYNINKMAWDYWTRRLAVNGPTGALPSQIEDYVENMCAKKDVNISTHWDYFQGYEKDYESIKNQLSQGIPVIWAVHDMYNGAILPACDDLGISHPDIERLQFYTYDAETGTYEKTSGAASHYVTITAIYESTNPDGSMKRMLEISTWGQKQYVDFDEYIDYVSGDPTNQPFSSITNTTVK